MPEPYRPLFASDRPPKPPPTEKSLRLMAEAEAVAALAVARTTEALNLVGAAWGEDAGVRGARLAEAVSLLDRARAKIKSFVDTERRDARRRTAPGGPPCPRAPSS